MKLSSHDHEPARARRHEPEVDPPEVARLARRTAHAAATSSAATSSGSLTAIQRFANAVNAGIHAARALSDDETRSAAARGVAGAGRGLPHGDVIQAAFGHHDVSGIRAHVGGAAAEAAHAIGATGYASGDAVAFAGAPDLRLAAHEAAHIVQQRGGVRLSGGIGSAGDTYEQHADAVAELVVRGESAEALLDTMAHRGARGGAAVQRTPGDVAEGGRAADDPAQLRGAELTDLFALYAAGGGDGGAGDVYAMPGGATFSRAWLRGPTGTAIVRGEIRARMVPGVTEAQAQAWGARLDGLTGDAARIAELRAMIAQARERAAAGHTATSPELVDVGTQGRTYAHRGTSRVDGADMSDRIHAAMDVPSPTGTGVYAPAAGTVVSSGRVRGYGNLVTLLHEQLPAPYEGRRFQTAYAHLSERLVEGGAVSAGQAIGLVGNTRTDAEGDGGRVAGGMAPHLHFGVIELFDGAAAGPWSSPREERYGARRDHVRPDDWLAAIGTHISDAPRSDSAVPATSAPAPAPTPTVQRTPTPAPTPAPDVAAALPAGVTQAQVDDAVAFNGALRLRIDWVRRMQQHLLADGTPPSDPQLATTHHMTSVDGSLDAATVVAVMRFQAEAGLAVDGHITAETRAAIEARFPDLHATLVGSHLDARVLVPAAAGDAERYGYYRDIVRQAGGVFLDGPGEINMLGIRGVQVTGEAGHLELAQTTSAAEFAAARAASGDPLEGASGEAGDGAATTSRHFSGRTSRDHGFDDVIITLSYEAGDGDARVYHVTEHRGSVDPQSHWSEATVHDRPTHEGTAHLRDGTYRYRLGLHTTHAEHHVAAVDRFDSPRAMRVTSPDADTRRYRALVPASGLEVWRDDEHDDDHFLTGAEEATSDAAIAERDPRYVDDSIAINIHTAGRAAPSSQGCQNVPEGEHYEEMIGDIAASPNADHVYYTLIDASRVAGVLTVERSAPM